MDYTKLRDLLKAGEWREAEDEQRAKLAEAAGEEGTIAVFVAAGDAWLGGLLAGLGRLRHRAG